MTMWAGAIAAVMVPKAVMMPMVRMRRWNRRRRGHSGGRRRRRGRMNAAGALREGCRWRGEQQECDQRGADSCAMHDFPQIDP